MRAEKVRVRQVLPFTFTAVGLWLYIAGGLELLNAVVPGEDLSGLAGGARGATRWWFYLLLASLLCVTLVLAQRRLAVSSVRDAVVLATRASLAFVVVYMLTIGWQNVVLAASRSVLIALGIIGASAALARFGANPVLSRRA